MSSFYKFFTDDEVLFIRKEFRSWIELEVDNRLNG